MSTSAGQAAVVCPSATDISPCICRASVIDPNGIAINCTSAGLNDLQMSSILNAFLLPGVSPVIELEAVGNRLTKVPLPISKFTAIASLDFSGYDNQITSIPVGSFVSFATNINIYLYFNQLNTIPSGAFTFPNAKTIYIGLDSNFITTIAPGAFNFPVASDVRLDFGSNLISSIDPGTFNQGKTILFSPKKGFLVFSVFFTGDYLVIQLRNNLLTQFESSIFQSILETMDENNFGWIGLANSNSSPFIYQSHKVQNCKSFDVHFGDLFIKY